MRHPYKQKIRTQILISLQGNGSETKKSCDEGSKDHIRSTYESTEGEITGLSEVQHRDFDGDSRLEVQREGPNH